MQWEPSGPNTKHPTTICVARPGEPNCLKAAPAEPRALCWRHSACPARRREAPNRWVCHWVRRGALAAQPMGRCCCAPCRMQGCGCMKRTKPDMPILEHLLHVLCPSEEGLYSLLLDMPGISGDPHEYRAAGCPHLLPAMAVLELPACGAVRVSAGAGAAARACGSCASAGAAGPRAALRPRLRVSCASASVVSLTRRAASLRSGGIRYAALHAPIACKTLLACNFCCSLGARTYRMLPGQGLWALTP